MSKFLNATADASGVVTADDVQVPAAVILSEGKQASTGVLIIEEENALYLTSSATDIKTTIEKIIAAIDSLAPALTTIANALTAIGAGMTGPTTAPPPTLPTSVIDINAKVTALNATKTQLNTLKGALK